VTSGDGTEDLVQVTENLSRHVRHLEDLARQGADAEAIDEAVSRCVEAFSRLENFCTNLENSDALADASGSIRAADCLKRLSACYEDCLATLSEASARVAIQLANQQKKNSAFQQYEKIAALKA